MLLLAADIEAVDGNGDLAALDAVSTPDLARLIGVGSPGAYGRAGKRVPLQDSVSKNLVRQSTR